MEVEWILWLEATTQCEIACETLSRTNPQIDFEEEKEEIEATNEECQFLMWFSIINQFLWDVHVHLHVISTDR